MARPMSDRPVSSMNGRSSNSSAAVADALEDDVAHAGRDRSLADADQTASDSDQALSGVDQASADSDQLAADLDQGGDIVLRAAERRRRAARQRAKAAEQRVLAAEDRLSAERDREQAARERRRSLVDREMFVVELQRERDLGDEALGDQRRAEQLARTLQRSLSPPSLPDVCGLDVAVRHEPSAAEDVGGDFYDVFPLADGRSGFFLDVDRPLRDDVAIMAPRRAPAR